MKVSLIGVALLALSSTIGFAQTARTQPAQVPAHSHAVSVNQRRAFQQRRIARGIRTGRINAHQAVRLERREASIGRQEHRMRAAGNGHLNHIDRVRLNRRLNRTSRAIYRYKNRSNKAITPARQ